MKTIGLLGGMSWESTSEYYRIINQEIQLRLGGVHSAQCVLYSVDFAEIEALQRSDDWAAATEAMIAAALKVQAADAEVLVICTNTMHKMAAEVQQALDIPLLHIADATAAAVRAGGITSAGLLGTRFTMEETFYRDHLTGRGLKVLIPNAEDRIEVDRVIFEELVRGEINLASKGRYVQVMRNLITDGAEGIILGCTEIGMLVGAGDVDVPVFDTTRLHALAAVDFALE